jgi:hypothetical protein
LTTPVFAWTAIYGFRRYGATLMKWAPPMVIGATFYMVAYYLVFYVVLDQGLEFLAGQSSVPIFAVFIFTTILTTRRAAELSGEKRLPKLTALAYLGLVVATFLYLFIIPRLWFAAWMTDVGRILIRLILHPLFFELANFAVRSLVRSVDIKAEPRRLFNLLLPGIVFNALYGRFLVAASSSTTVTIILALLLSGLEVFLRVSVGARDRLLFRITHSKEETHSRFSTVQSVRLRADLVAVEQVVENASIVAATALTYIFDLSVDGSRVTLERAVTDCSLQLGIEFLTDFFVTLTEIRWAGVPILIAWQTRFARGEFVRHHAFFFTLACIALLYTVTSFISDALGWVSFRPHD